MSEESSSEEESLQVLSVQSDSSKSDDEAEPTPTLPKKEKKKSKKKKSKHSKSSSKLDDNSRETVKKKKLKSKLIKGFDKLNLQEIVKFPPYSQSTKDKKKLIQEPEKKKIIHTDQTEIQKPSPIDKSKLRYSQTNLAKIINKPLYDRKAEESISNILNRKTTCVSPPKSPPNKTTSFTTKSYIDKSAAIIEADQTIKFKDQKPVLGQRISPEKMTKSVNIIVRHLYKNKKSLDIQQLTQQDSKSIIKFSLSSSINEEGERFD